jgi:hypothetical protein
MPLALLKFVPLPGSEGTDRAVGSAINQGHRARRGAFLLGEMLRDFLLEVLWPVVIAKPRAAPMRYFVNISVILMA